VKLLLIGSVVDSAHQRSSEAYADGLRELVRSNGMEERVIFAGWRDDIPLLLSASDSYVHSARWEGPPLCLAVLEGMAARRPVISTDCSGWPEGFAQGVHGYVVRTEDVDALAGAMRGILSASAAERREMGEAARRLAEESYDISVIGDRFVDLVEAATRPRSSAARRSLAQPLEQEVAR
jgi:glycosyltransferase involved in cell wall biosynthesis